MARGSNQSASTKYATLLICDAVVLLKSGRAESARRLMNRALRLLPDVGDATQKESENEDRNQGRGFYA